MCGIVGFTGKQQAAPILLEGLSKLEYRGYDSAGLAVRDGKALAQVVTHSAPSFSLFICTYPLQSFSVHYLTAFLGAIHVCALFYWICIL